MLHVLGDDPGYNICAFAHLCKLRHHQSIGEVKLDRGVVADYENHETNGKCSVFTIQGFFMIATCSYGKCINLFAIVSHVTSVL